MGIERFDTIKPYALRGLFITRLETDKSVSVVEQMAAAHYNSVTASLPYQGRGVESECNRLNALIGRGGK